MTNPISLAALIKQHQDETGHSYMDIARASGLSKAKIGQLAQAEGVHMPRIETLRKLADGLRIPLHVVQTAAMVTAGITPEGAVNDQRLDLIIARIGELHPDDLEYVDTMVGALLAKRRRG